MKLIPFEAFFEAWFRPRICERIFSDTASPEASSPARLIFSPDESFSISFLRLKSVTPKERLANIADMLWLMTIIFSSMENCQTESFLSVCKRLHLYYKATSAIFYMKFLTVIFYEVEQSWFFNLVFRQNRRRTLTKFLKKL